jgi:hypothetical protein
MNGLFGINDVDSFLPYRENVGLPCNGRRVPPDAISNVPFRDASKGLIDESRTGNA